MKRVRENPLFFVRNMPPPCGIGLLLRAGRKPRCPAFVPGRVLHFRPGRGFALRRMWKSCRMPGLLLLRKRGASVLRMRGRVIRGRGCRAMLLRMRASPLRVSGVVPMRASNSVSSIASHASASIASGSNTGSKAGLVCIGAFWLWGQQLWQRSQPKIQPSRPIPSVGSFSIVWQEIQRPVSITFGATIAPSGSFRCNCGSVRSATLRKAGRRRRHRP